MQRAYADRVPIILAEVGHFLMAFFTLCPISNIFRLSTLLPLDIFLHIR